jgi:hypothetical protein
MSAPRLTRALRTFAAVSATHDDDLTIWDGDLSRRRLQLAAATQLKWPQLVDMIRSCADTGSETDGVFRPQLDRLMKAAKEIAGKTEDDFGFVEDAAVFLFGFFSRSTTGSATRDEVSRLHSYFGPLTISSAAAACSAVYSVCSELPDDGLASHHCSTGLGSGLQAGGEGSGKEFGEAIKIKFGPTSNDADEDVDWLESDEESDAAGFSLNFGNVAAKPDKSCDQPQPASMAKGERDGIPDEFDPRKWLRSKMAEHFDGDGHAAALDDIVNAVSRNADFRAIRRTAPDRFVRSTRNRSSRLDAGTARQPENRSHRRRRRDPTRTDLVGGGGGGGRRQLDGARPAVACQVVVQTQDEKMLHKFFRREEKKCARRRDGANDRGFDDDGCVERSILKSFEPPGRRPCATPQRRRSSHPLAVAARRLPPTTCRTFSIRSTRPDRSSSFIAGSKMLLPADLARVNNNVYEEINIPANEKPPHNFKYNTDHHRQPGRNRPDGIQRHEEAEPDPVSCLRRRVQFQREPADMRPDRRRQNQHRHVDHPARTEAAHIAGRRA